MLTASFVGGLLGDSKPPQIYDAFPGLFEEEKRLAELNRIKTQMSLYAQLWNKKHAKEEELNG